MRNECRPDIGLSYVSAIPDSAVKPFLDELAHPRLLVKTEQREARFYASLEWLVPTAAVVYLAKSYFDGFLKEAGKDHYNGLKKGVGALWVHFFGKERALTATAIACPPGKVASSEPKYSLALSLVAEGAEGRTFKLLLAEASTKEELEDAVGKFQDFLAGFHAGEVEDAMAAQLRVKRPLGGIVLLAYDPVSDALQVVDPLPVAKMDSFE